MTATVSLAMDISKEINTSLNSLCEVFCRFSKMLSKILSRNKIYILFHQDFWVETIKIILDHQTCSMLHTAGIQPSNKEHKCGQTMFLPWCHVQNWWLMSYTQALQKLLEAADTQQRAVQSSHSIPVGNNPPTQHSPLKGAPFT